MSDSEEYETLKYLLLSLRSTKGWVSRHFNYADIYKDDVKHFNEYLAKIKDKISEVVKISEKITNYYYTNELFEDGEKFEKEIDIYIHDMFQRHSLLSKIQDKTDKSV